MWNCDEGMGANGRPFIRLLGLPAVTVTVSADSLVNVGGRRTVSCWNSCFEGDDVFKELETTSISKGRMDYFYLRLLQDIIPRDLQDMAESQVHIRALTRQDYYRMVAAFQLISRT